MNPIHIAMPPETIDDTAAFNELVEKITFYQDIIQRNQPYLRENHDISIQKPTSVLLRRPSISSNKTLSLSLNDSMARGWVKI